MNSYLLALLLLLGLASPFQTIWADEDFEDEKKEEAISRIDGPLSEKVGIVTSKASPRTLSQTAAVYGTLIPDPEHTFQVHARFPGVIKSVSHSVGDTVKKGDRLAVIESNESLKSYQLNSPASGIVLHRQANVGETTQGRLLFNITNFDALWAEFRIYPAQQSKVHAGQTVLLIVNEQSISAVVAHVVPVMNKPYLLARVKLNNEGQNLSPGLLAKGKIQTRQFDVALAVEKKSVQELGGRLGVFVKEGELYTFTPLVLGQSDDQFYEVLEGLDSGTEYVSKNSYLIKADILKSEAEDDD